MPNLDIIYDLTIAVTWDEIKTNQKVIYIINLLPYQVSSHSMYCTSVYGLKLSVLSGMGGKALATDHRVTFTGYIKRSFAFRLNFIYLFKASLSSAESCYERIHAKIDQNPQFVARLKKSKSLFFCIVVDLSKYTNAM